MTKTISTVQEYIDQVTPERLDYFTRLRDTILENIPKGFEEQIQYKMPAYVVPHSLYPDGYHCNPDIPLPFVSIANQKNFIALYHMGIYAIPELHDWFVEEYKKRVPRKLDMGKSCIRFKKMEDIPYDLIAELMQKVNPKQWIKVYEENIQKK